MGPSAALEMALRLVERPASARRASSIPLPTGITLLLEVAVGDPVATGSAEAMTRRSREALETASGFFIEQVMFARGADSYRVLGSERSAPRRQLRRHMALLVKWLHPDGHDLSACAFAIHRSVFVHRVTQAWEDLKNDERRAAYDRIFPDSANDELEPSKDIFTSETSRALIGCAVQKNRRYRRLVIYPIQNDTLLSRLLYHLRGLA